MVFFMKTYKICILLPYLGKWPWWFSYFLKSCETNKNFDFLFFTDNDPPINYPDNVYFNFIEKKGLVQLVRDKTGIQVTLENPYKLCEFKPTYGKVFEDFIGNYNFWGYGDIDLIYGDLNKYLSLEILDNYEIISPHNNFIPGHFCILKNTTEIVNLFSKAENFKKVFSSERYHYFDEIFYKKGVDLMKEKALSENVKKRIRNQIILNRIRRSNLYKLFRTIWNKRSNRGTDPDSPLLDFNQIVQAYNHPKRTVFLQNNVFRDDIMRLSPKKTDWNIKWEDGKLFLNEQEIMYYHFQLAKSQKNFSISEISENSFKLIF